MPRQAAVFLFGTPELMESQEIIPFGKYKGQPIEVLASDKQYTDWLTSQKWFAERFSGIHTLIVNNFCEPECTPEHNRIQLMFLDKAFAYWCMVSACGCCLHEDFIENSVLMKNQMSRLSHVKSMCADVIVDFEVGGWDVRVDASIDFWGDLAESDKDFKKYSSYNGISAGHSCCCEIEIKPSISDDFPSVMRQVKSRRNASKNRIVLCEFFSCQEATFEEVKEFFWKSRIRLVRLCDIDVKPLPEFFQSEWFTGR